MTGAEAEFEHASRQSAFDDWFYTAEAKAASALYVSRFITNHRDQLYRLV